MTPLRAIELATAETIKRFADVGITTTIRAFLNMNFGGAWNEDIDRELPFIGVRGTPPTMDTAEASQIVDINIDIATNARDDRSHEQLADIYEAVQELLDKMFAQFRNGQDGEEYNYFNERVLEHTARIANSTISLTFIDPQAPYDDGGINVISIGLSAHFGRVDF